MPRFNEFYYNTDKYGIKPSLAYSAEPVTAVAINYDKVQISWLSPVAPENESYSDFRVVRSQDGFPQTQEDGDVVYSYKGTPDKNTVYDTPYASDNPLRAGEFAYYRLWVRKRVETVTSWIPVGSAYTLVPSPHNLVLGRSTVYSGVASDGYTTTDKPLWGNPLANPIVSTTHQRFLGILPAVITSATNSATDAVTADFNKYGKDPFGNKDNSLISTFLSAFSFTFDEFLTFSALITPNAKFVGASPTNISLSAHQLGITNDIEAATPTQKRMVRNAITSYKKKGTVSGLELIAQSITGYDAEVSTLYGGIDVSRFVTTPQTLGTPNILLSYEDSTFKIPGWTSDDPIGNWTAITSSVSIEVNSEQAPGTISLGATGRSVDQVYSLKVTPTATGQSIGLGVSAPVLKGIPVIAGVPYSLSFWAKEAASSGGNATTVEIRWFRRDGSYISSSSVSRTISTTTWTEYKLENQAAPTSLVETDKAVYACIVLTFADAEPLYMDMVQLEQATASTAYQEPRAAIVKLNPTSTNYIKDPTMGLDTTGATPFTYWNPVGTSAAELVSDQSYSGVGAIKLTASGSGQASLVYKDTMPYLVNSRYSASIYVKNMNMSDKFIVGFDIWDAVTPFPGVIYPNYNDVEVVTSGEWTRITHSITTGSQGLEHATNMAAIIVSDAPPPYTGLFKLATIQTSTPHGLVAGQSVTIPLSALGINTSLTYTAQIYATPSSYAFVLPSPVQYPNGAIYIPGGGGEYWFQSVYSAVAVGMRVSTLSSTPTAGGVAYFDAAQLELADHPSDYFDGSVVDDGNVWVGLPNASYSAKYPAQANRVNRLANEISSYLPLGTPYFIDLVSGNVHSGIS